MASTQVISHPVTPYAVFSVYQPLNPQASPEVSINPYEMVRPDRLVERPNCRNAQGLFPWEACLFVGNLSRGIPLGDLSRDLNHKIFARFGSCYPKVILSKSNRNGGRWEESQGSHGSHGSPGSQGSQNGRRNLAMPIAFVQFETIESAMNALLAAQNDRDGSHFTLHGRRMRVEQAKGDRTYAIGYRSGRRMTPESLHQAVYNLGPIDGYTAYDYSEHWAGGLSWTVNYLVTFHYVQDGCEAVQHLENDATFWIKKVFGNLSNPGPATWYPPVQQGPNQPDMVHPVANQFSGPTIGEHTVHEPAPEQLDVQTPSGPSIGADAPTLAYPNPPMAPETYRTIRKRSKSEPRGIWDEDGKRLDLASCFNDKPLPSLLGQVHET